MIFTYQEKQYLLLPTVADFSKEGLQILKDTIKFIKGISKDKMWLSVFVHELTHIQDIANNQNFNEEIIGADVCSIIKSNNHEYNAVLFQVAFELEQTIKSMQDLFFDFRDTFEADFTIFIKETSVYTEQQLKSLLTCKNFKEDILNLIKEIEENEGFF